MTRQFCDDGKFVPNSLRRFMESIGAEQRNFSKWVKTESDGGYSKEIAILNISPDGTINCRKNPNLIPNPIEAEKIKNEWAEIEFPKMVNASDACVKNFRENMLQCSESNFFDSFIDRSNSTNPHQMVQERIDKIDGGKIYITWTFYNDGNWRAKEPDFLPLFKPRVKSHTMIGIVEGAKAARAIHKMFDPNQLEIDRIKSENHPWYKELSLFEWWGWIGGAPNPWRTNWKELRRENPTEILVICDNDDIGKDALVKISERLARIKVRGIFLDKRWPEKWDLADPFPQIPEFWTTEQAEHPRRYKGPSLFSMRRPATWATKEVVVPGKKRKLIKNSVLDEFNQEWIHTIRPLQFVNIDFPNKQWTKEEFNISVAPYSKVKDLAELMFKYETGKGTLMSYSPGKPSGLFVTKEGRFLNTWTPSLVMPMEGKSDQIKEFFEMLFPDPVDRAEMIRWCATLVCHPEIKMLYGVLLVSEKQGVGKTSLAERILAPLIGEQNVSYPTESDISESAFNDWAGHKRLAICNEIYQGQSAKAYNRLKSLITDHTITVNKKYLASYMIDNWLHVFACSNSFRALQLSTDDRRWFVPKVTENRWPTSRWRSFFSWLDDGGLEIVRWWFKKWLSENNPVQPGTDAPYNLAKKQMIENTMSPGQLLVKDVLEELNAPLLDEEGNVQFDSFDKVKRMPFATTDLTLVNLIIAKLYDGKRPTKAESQLTICKLARACGFYIGERRIKLVGRSDFGKVITNVETAKIIIKDENDFIIHEEEKRVSEMNAFEINNSYTLNPGNKIKVWGVDDMMTDNSISSLSSTLSKSFAEKISNVEKQIHKHSS